MRVIAAGLVALYLSFVQASPARLAPELKLSVVPENNQVQEAGPVNLIIIIENNSEQDVQVTALNLISGDKNLTPLKPVPASIPAKTLAMGLYSVPINKEASHTLIVDVTYARDGQTQHAVAQTEVKLQPKAPSLVLRDLFLVLTGALSGILGSVGTEAIKGWIERRRVVKRQAERALSVLIPELEVCIRAVEQNRDAPVTLWHDVYFKEGLHTALTSLARSLKRERISADITLLYARLTEYNADKQFADRPALVAELTRVRDALQSFL